MKAYILLLVTLLLVLLQQSESYNIEGLPPTDLNSNSACEGCVDNCSGPCSQDDDFPAVYLPTRLHSLTNCQFPPDDANKRPLTMTPSIDINDLTPLEQNKYSLEGGNKYLRITNLSYGSVVEFYTCDRSDDAKCISDSRRASKSTSTAIAAYDANTKELLGLQSACDICQGVGSFCGYLKFSNSDFESAATDIIIQVFGVKPDLIKGTSSSNAACGLTIPSTTFLYVRRLDSEEPCEIDYSCDDTLVYPIGDSCVSSPISVDEDCGFELNPSFYYSNGTEFDLDSLDCGDIGFYPNVRIKGLGQDLCTLNLTVVSDLELFSALESPSWYPNPTYNQFKCGYLAECSFDPVLYKPPALIVSECYSSAIGMDFFVTYDRPKATLGDHILFNMNVEDLSGNTAEATSIVLVAGLRLDAVIYQDEVLLYQDDSGASVLKLYEEETYTIEFSYASYDYDIDQIQILLIPSYLNPLTSESLDTLTDQYYEIDSFSLDRKKREIVDWDSGSFEWVTDGDSTRDITITSGYINDEDIGKRFYLAMVSCVYPDSFDLYPDEPQTPIEYAYGFENYEDEGLYYDEYKIYDTNILLKYTQPNTLVPPPPETPDKKRGDNCGGYCSGSRILVLSNVLPLVTVGRSLNNEEQTR